MFKILESLFQNHTSAIGFSRSWFIILFSSNSVMFTLLSMANMNLTGWEFEFEEKGLIGLKWRKMFPVDKSCLLINNS